MGQNEALKEKSYDLFGYGFDHISRYSGFCKAGASAYRGVCFEQYS